MMTTARSWLLGATTAAAAFCLALFFRTIDLWVCPSWPLGTHFLWHLFNGSVVYLAMRGLKLCALDELLDTAICLEDTEIHKPEPEPILAALDRLQLSREEAAYVGDSCHDIIAGRRAGVKTVAALWGPLPRADLECEQPDYLAESINELLDIFP